MKYEDLLAAPEIECSRVLSYLGLHRRDDHIKEAIDRQSVEEKRASFLRNNETAKASFMRAGRSGQWMHELTRKQKGMFSQMLSDELEQLGYTTDRSAQ